MISAISEQLVNTYAKVGTQESDQCCVLAVQPLGLSTCHYTPAHNRLCAFMRESSRSLRIYPPNLKLSYLPELVLGI